jgi:four helix bundle protein
MQLRIYGVALQTIETVGPIASVIGREDRDLARQLRRAATSVVLNLAEGERQRGGNRRSRFETAIGSANESVACLDCALALGYVGKSDAVAAAQDGFDRVGRTLTRLMKAGR